MKRALILAIMAVFSLSAFAQKSNIQTVVIQTNGVCQKCADKFSENVPFFKGVKTYSYDMKTAKLRLRWSFCVNMRTILTFRWITSLPAATSRRASCIRRSPRLARAILSLRNLWRCALIRLLR